MAGKSLFFLKASCALVFHLLTFSNPEEIRVCEELNGYFPGQKDTILDDATLRAVDPLAGADDEACLNEGNLTDAPPCKTLQYALHGHENITVPINDLVIRVAPGTIQLTGSLLILNSHRVAILGSGVDSTFFHCGTFGNEDMLCAYMNLQIRKSSHVYLSGVTFTQCGPITSSLYVADSDHVFVEDCAFSNMTSPPVLLYNTLHILFNNTIFTSNSPQYLSREVSTDICYFSGGQDVFFLDNRTTSGGISLYIEGGTLNLLISGCTFSNLSARPDLDISLPRFSTRYGHGGAVNVRLVHSSNSKVCIENSSFLNNSAEAHAGALAMAFADSASMNRALVQNCRFENNSCSVDKCSAGAFGADFFADTSFNELHVSATNFTGNTAPRGSGGAMSLSAADLARSQGETNSVTLRDCRFERNRAFYEGTALGSFSVTHANQPGLPVKVIDCMFLGNQGSAGSEDTTAVTVYRVLITFEGESYFMNNKGGGLTLLEARLDVMGTVEFEGNMAVFGAGVAISGRSLVLLYSGSYLKFMNNSASEIGGGMYVEYTSSDFVLDVLNRGCFLQYFSSTVDVAPDEWNATVEFTANTARLAGAALYANDMSRCRWLGKNLTDDYFIFQTPRAPNYSSPFILRNNSVMSPESVDNDLATDASTFSATTAFNSSRTPVSFGEKISFRLSSSDQLSNFREAVWSLDVNGTLDPQPLGALSTDGTVYVYEVPGNETLATVVQVEDGTANITATFMLTGSQSQPYTVPLMVDQCHPGYSFDKDTQECDCQDHLRQIVGCDSLHRYFYAKDGFWVGVREDNSPFFSTTVPGFLNCTRAGTLPGCLYKFDQPNDQCAPGREGTLCGECEDGYGVTFDLRFCKENCGAGGIVLFITICIATFLVALLILYFDFPIPNEMKGVIFFAQVIGVIYRNTPYLLDQPGPGYLFFDFVINALGYAMPFPVCLWENLPVIGVAFLGFIPPIIATVTAIVYVVGAQTLPFLSKRTTYKFNGFYFLWLFVYKYLVDTSFIFVSCTKLDEDIVFIYDGSQKCLDFPFVVMLVFAVLFLLVLGLVLPLYGLHIIYKPKKAIQVSNTLTAGLKDRRRYRWYGVWDIWRRLPFVAANLFISLTTQSTVLFIHCILILVCLVVVCTLKPYKRSYINVIEVCILLCLFGATIAILDENDVYVGTTTSIVIVSIPFTFGFCFIVYKLVQYVWHKADKRWRLNNEIKEKFGPRIVGIPQYEHLYRLWIYLRDYQWMDTDNCELDDADTVWNTGERSTGDEEIDRESDSRLREPLLDEIPPASQ